MGKRKTPEEILAVLREEMPALRERYGVQSLGVFGSYIRGDAGPESDLDILVEFDETPLTLIQFVELENHLSDLLGVKVDLVEKSALKPAIGHQIVAKVKQL